MVIMPVKPNNGILYKPEYHGLEIHWTTEFDL